MLPDNELVSLAKKELKNSYSPYSGFKVAAALITKNGKVYTGANIENSSYSATVCAERVALFKAISNGERGFEAIAIVCEKGDFCYPCGVCRQVMMEFCRPDSFRVITAKNATKASELFSRATILSNHTRLRNFCHILLS